MSGRGLWGRVAFVAVTFMLVAAYVVLMLHFSGPRR